MSDGRLSLHSIPPDPIPRSITSYVEGSKVPWMGRQIAWVKANPLQAALRVFVALAAIVAIAVVLTVGVALISMYALPIAILVGLVALLVLVELHYNEQDKLNQVYLGVMKEVVNGIKENKTLLKSSEDSGDFNEAMALCEKNEEGKAFRVFYMAHMRKHPEEWPSTENPKQFWEEVTTGFIKQYREYQQIQER